MKPTCQNPDEQCGNLSSLLWDGLFYVCRRCYMRFYRNNIGKKHDGWDLYWQKRGVK